MQELLWQVEEIWRWTFWGYVDTGFCHITQSSFDDLERLNGHW
jgi:hypothetical protein